MSKFTEKNDVTIKNYRMLSLFVMIGIIAILGVSLFFYSSSPKDNVNAVNGNYQVYLIVLSVLTVGIIGFLSYRKKTYFKPENVKHAWYQNSHDEQGLEVSDPEIRSMRIIFQHINLELFMLEGYAIIGLIFAILLSMEGEMPKSALDVLFFLPPTFFIYYALRNRNDMDRIDKFHQTYIFPVVTKLKQ